MSEDKVLANIHWKPLWEIATCVLRASQGPAEIPEKKIWRPVTAGALTHPPYQLTSDDLALLDRYVGIYSSRFKYQNQAADIKQELVIELLRTNYLARYDPTQNSKNGYLNAFVKNFFCKLYKHAAYPVNRAIPLEDMEVSLEESITDSDEPMDPKTWAALEGLITRLENRHPASTGVRYKGSTYLEDVYVGQLPLEGETIIWKSAANILMLIVLGFRQEEIARLFHQSKGWVFKQVKRIRQEPLVHAWAEEYDLFRKKPNAESITQDD